MVAPGPFSRMGLCPRCHQPLEAREGHLARCSGADGAFVDSHGLTKLAPFAAMAAYSEAAEHAAPGRASCPDCGATMSTLHVQRHGDRIELDACPACGGTWFDLGELERLTAPTPNLPRGARGGGGRLALHGGQGAALAAGLADPAVLAGLFEAIAALFDS